MPRNINGHREDRITGRPGDIPERSTMRPGDMCPEQFIGARGAPQQRLPVTKLRFDVVSIHV